jgi:Protein of unknown function (DUF429)
MTVLSIDLAYRKYKDFGVAVLKDGPPAEYELVPFFDKVDSIPEPEATADRIVEICESNNTHIVLIDGPQGWKDPGNGWIHSRDCERSLNTPAKTGLPGNAKPGGYIGFIDFSIKVFDALDARGWRRHDPATWQAGDRTVVESFPLSAWRSLKLPALPAKRRARSETITKHAESLVDAGLIRRGKSPTHDQLQAIVAGLGGLRLANGNAEFEYRGTSPLLLEGTWREGYIVNPIVGAMR